MDDTTPTDGTNQVGDENILARRIDLYPTCLANTPSRTLALIEALYALYQYALCHHHSHQWLSAIPVILCRLEVGHG